jgi:hypothetical protein
MTQPMNDETRQRLAQFLPDAIASALESYRLFLKHGPQDVKGPDDDPSKNFKAHHDACKVAIAHIELLIKLGKSIETVAEELEEERRAAFFASLQSAQEEVDLNDLEDEDGEPA